MVLLYTRPYFVTHVQDQTNVTYIGLRWLDWNEVLSCVVLMKPFPRFADALFASVPLALARLFILMSEMVTAT